ncbi:Aminotransferase-like, plant mobile domain [Sesbania bispinosa]|nr:Aminotransferase-like, plant mobile domain [Sesbania bispinosa]
MEDSSSELIPRSVSFTTWSRLPPARVVPVDSDSLVSQVVRREEALLFHDVPNMPTHLVGPSLLRSHVRRQEFPWSPIIFSTRYTFTGCWAEWVDHIFANDTPFVDILNKVGIADAIKLSHRLGAFRKVDDLEYLVQRWSHITHTFYTAWGEFTPPLEDVYVLLKLPVFGDCDITNIVVESHLIDMAKDLKAATTDSARYSREFLAKRCITLIPHVDPAAKTPPKKVHGTGNVLPPEQRKSARESLNP